MSNKRNGSKFERELCEILSNYGHWVHNFTQNQSGQPADIIAVKNGRANLIDCKVCDTDTFALPRIEENQKLAMQLWEKCGNHQGWFALQTSEAIYMITLSDLLDFSKQKKVMNINDIKENAIPIWGWL